MSITQNSPLIVIKNQSYERHLNKPRSTFYRQVNSQLKSDILKLKKEFVKRTLQRMEHNDISLKSLLNIKEVKTPIFPLLSWNQDSEQDLDMRVVRLVTTKIYKKSMEELFGQEIEREDHSDSPIYSRLVLPTLFSKNALIRRPLKTETNKIEKLHIQAEDYDPFFLQLLIEQEGISLQNDRIDRLMILSSTKNKHKRIGVIHYYIKDDHCWIESVKIKKKHRGQGYGSQLIGYAIFDALERNCNKISLSPTNRSLFFYYRLGFYRDDHDFDTWKKMSHEEKFKNSGSYCDLMLDLTNKKNLKQFYKKLNSDLN